MVFSRRDRARGLAAAACAAVGLAGPAKADSLADALLQAYRTNPSLASVRDQLRALDESVVQAKTGLRPTLSVNASLTHNEVDRNTSTFLTPSKALSDQGAWGLNASQPIYNGGRTTAAIRSAEASVLAGRASLLAGEQSILQSVIQAYMDVRRDQQILEIRQAELKILDSQLDDARLRFKAGDVTETDVLQSQTQAEAARANLSLAQGQLQNSRAEYRAVVGEDPGELDAEPPLPGVPASAEQAMAAADADNPSLRQAWYQEQASRQRIAQARAAYRPAVTLQASAGYTEGGGASPTDPRFYHYAPATSFVAQVSVTQPLFTGGLNASGVRQALAANASDQMNIEVARRGAIQAVAQAWNSFTANRASAALDQQQVKTAQGYFEDTQTEYRVGQRSTLDVLVAEQTLTAAKVALASARHDAYLGQVALLSATGRLQLRYLLEGVAVYDPTASYRRVNRIGATPIDPIVRGIDAIGAPRPAAPRPPAVDIPPLKSDPAMIRSSNSRIVEDQPDPSPGPP